MKLTKKRIGHLVIDKVQPNTIIGTAIVIPGLPQLIQKHALVSFLYELGYEVWLPQLSGSWDSGNSFNPETHLDDLALLASEAPQLQAMIGYSYGAGITALFASKGLYRGRMGLIAPMLDYRPYSAQAASLISYLEEFYPFSYRLAKDELLKHLQGELINPIETNPFPGTRYFLSFGSDDPDMDQPSIQSFSHLAGIQPYAAPCTHSLDGFLADPIFKQNLKSFLQG